MTTYWHTGAHECSAEEFVAFIAWASTQAKLERGMASLTRDLSTGARRHGGARGAACGLTGGNATR